MPTRRPLTILVHPKIESWPEWEAIKKKGHRVVTMYDLVHLVTVKPDEVDIWFGPTMWRMDEWSKPWLDDAIEEATRVRYPKRVETMDNRGS